MEIIVRDIDIDVMETKLKAAGFARSPSEKRIMVDSNSGACTLETDFRKVFRYFVGWSRQIKVCLGDPGELCLRIEGSSDLFVTTLMALDIPTSDAQKMIHDIK